MTPITNSRDFHEKLNFLSEASDPDDLALRVCGKGNIGNIAVDEKSAEKVSIVLENFLSDNANQIEMVDLPALKKIENLAQWFSSFARGALDDDKKGRLKTLEKTAALSIQIAQTIRIDDFYPHSEQPLRDVFGIVGEYLSVGQFFDLKKSGMDIPIHAVKGTIEKMWKFEEIREFILKLREAQESNPKNFKEMIDVFFKYAKPRAQKNFFSLIQNPKFLSEILSALPKNLTHLVIKCPCLSDFHLKILARRLEYLESLHFREDSQLTDQGIIWLVRDSRMKNLKSLDFWHCDISDNVVIETARSSNMANLKDLSFSGCKRVSDRGISSLANSVNMDKLEYLNVGETSISDEGVRLLVDSPNMKNMQFLCFSGCEQLTDASASHLANNINSESEISMPNLKRLYFSMCVKITDAGVKSLAESPTLRLNELNLLLCDITDQSAIYISRSPNFQNLIRLQLGHCPRLTDNAIEALTESKSLPNLLYIDLDGCLITPEAARWVKAMKNRKRAAKK